MKNHQRKKIIIGYRYDPESYTAQRLQEIQTIQNDFSDEYFPTDCVKKTFQSDQILIEKLKNQNLLLKAQLHRIQQKSSFKSYQFLLQQYKQLQGEIGKLRVQIQQLKSTIKTLQERQESRQKIQKSQEETRTKKNQERKYTFAPYNKITIDNIIQEKSYYEKLKDIQTYRNTTTDDSLEQRFYESTLKQSQKLGFQSYNETDFEPSQNSFKYQTFNPLPYKFAKGIDSQYLYNDLRTINSQKSNEQVSQIQLGYNFSFMPQPIKKNINTLQALDQVQEINKKVRFNDQKTLQFSSSSKQVGNKKQQDFLNGDFSQQSLQQSQNLSNSNIKRLNGLRKLPNKSPRNQRRSNNSISLQQEN